MMFDLISCVFSLLTTDDTDEMKYERVIEATSMMASTCRYTLAMNL